MLQPHQTLQVVVRGPRSVELEDFELRQVSERRQPLPAGQGAGREPSAVRSDELRVVDVPDVKAIEISKSCQAGQPGVGHPRVGQLQGPQAGDVVQDLQLLVVRLGPEEINHLEWAKLEPRAGDARLDVDRRPRQSVEGLDLAKDPARSIRPGVPVGEKSQGNAQNQRRDCPARSRPGPQAGRRVRARSMPEQPRPCHPKKING